MKTSATYDDAIRTLADFSHLYAGGIVLCANRRETVSMMFGMHTVEGIAKIEADVTSLLEVRKSNEDRKKRVAK